ncbi:TPA: lipid II:glycine glycyltransferase FemX [Enterococcus faecium]|uniref:lipid II:glycine glycyltransferase FemX n=1 Tax=Enterococcus faecium TaxID=1352 RepID=UPI00035472E6|nr:peptidoglycan bridge formation glycyltransferase FemA/FemB family protein [Enterococcus faecium]EGP4989464.1 peptidoglycan bridge formation glycyltransferase FemA/FemB family protein [Enterococcus faecium]EPI20003.1 hypothetical protein D353_01666 [Enterococcus faecium OC2A-1]MCD5168049.1 peptidoglycan bridge formation glycyltransferase FemA/FemB family protein [Enterococcus faecium]NTM00451.1 peptidoglycan bridge formation glycyltransferase FemA/FemB family protein [Enterococcus faecium]OU
MLEVYTLQNSKKWDDIVRMFKDYDIYWLSGYVRAFKIHGDGEPLLFYYEKDKTRGINVVMKRDISKDVHFKDTIPENTYFDFSTPYGYGGWIIEGDNREDLFKTYNDWCKKSGIISEFVRFHPVIKNHILSEKEYEIVTLGQTIVMDLRSPEIIWKNITSKNRNMIRKAEKYGVKIFNGRSEELYEVFMKLYNKTMEYDHADSYYYFDQTFYQSICNDLPENAQIFYAVQDKNIIAMSIIVAVNEKMTYHLSGSKWEYRQFAPSNLLLYKAALWGCANGYKTFHLGGGVGSKEDNLFKFKRSFYRCDDLCSFHIGKKIYLLEKYEELVRMRNNKVASYFPMYRA